MRFNDFLKVTVLLSAAAATGLAALTLLSATRDGEQTVVFVAAVWWLVAAVIGIVIGRHAAVSPPIARLLADSRTTTTLPELGAGRVLANRLWPLLVPMLVAGALAFLFPPVPAVATGFAIIWALAWRRQESAVVAIEDRDGVAFYIERTSPLSPIRLVRTPGFRANFGQRQPSA